MPAVLARNDLPRGRPEIQFVFAFFVSEGHDLDVFYFAKSLPSRKQTNVGVLRRDARNDIPRVAAHERGPRGSSVNRWAGGWPFSLE